MKTNEKNNIVLTQCARFLVKKHQKEKQNKKSKLYMIILPALEFR